MRLPRYRLHKGSGQALVEWKGKRHYLGRFGSAESKAAYQRFLEQHVFPAHIVTPAAVGAIETEPTWMAVLLAAWLKDAAVRYAGTPTEYDRCRYMAKLLLHECGKMRAADFGPKRLKKIRADLVAKKVSRGPKATKTFRLTRTYINAQVQLIQRIFRFGVEEELIDAAVYQALKAVRPLRKGKTEAREPKKKKPVPLRHLVAMLEHAPPLIATMARVQYYTGMRSDNLCNMTLGDIDRREAIWIYEPHKHKRSHAEQELKIPLGPRVQKLLKPFLDRESDVPMFSPREASESLWAARRAARRSPMTPSQRKRRRKRKTVRGPGDRYTTASYRRAITRAIEDAGVPHWHPHRLRHTHGTRVRRKHKLEGSQATLGHANVSATQIYAEKNLDLAIQIAAEMG